MTLPLPLSGSVWEIISQTSTFGLFILICLVLMSVLSWVVIFHKWRQFKGVVADSDRFYQHYKRSRLLGDVQDQAASFPRSPLSTLYLVGCEELRAWAKRSDTGTISSKDASENLEVLEMVMEKSLTEEVTRLEHLTVVLATTTSAAPFLGLLGTVVGIMDSFWSIGERGSASLAIVAPGIAEALLATIVGLGAAIPAVIAYNWANTRTKNIHDRSSGFILDFVARVKRETL